MSLLNIEIKAKCVNPKIQEHILKSLGARFVGEDHQIDTYFSTNRGRLKLREGNIENSLIFYERENIAGPKKSDVILYKTKPESELKNILINTHDIIVVIDKIRKIYFIDNVKFHIDVVDGLGNFIEIEAIDQTGNIGEMKLNEQCNHYLNVLKIQDNDLIDISYSDLLLSKKK